jgi:hypothetical protein
MDIIEENPELPWSIRGISLNSNLTTDFIKKNINKDWDFEFIAYNTFTKEKEDFIKKCKKYSN